MYWICKCTCGEILSVCGNDLKAGYKDKCNNCAKDQYIENLRGKIYGKLLVLKRDSTKNKIFWICQCECGNIVSVHGSSLKTGHTKSCGCLKSKGEVSIENILKELQLRYIKQYTIKDEPVNKLRFDFAIIDNQSKILCLIEYQGIQHYNCVDYFGGQEGFEKQQHRDNLKRQYCKENNIKLIEIPYWDYDNLNKDYILNLIY